MSESQCRVFALAGDFVPQALTCKAALFLYPEVVLHSRLVTLLNSGRPEGINLSKGDLSIDGLLVTSPPAGLLTLLFGLAETGWLSPVGPDHPAAIPRMAGEFFESEAELRAVQAALRYEAPEGVTTADGQAHAEVMAYAAAGSSRLKLAKLELVDLLAACAAAEGALLDVRGSTLVDALLASPTLSAELEGVVDEPLRQQSDLGVTDRLSQQFALQVVAAALPNLAASEFAEIDAAREECRHSVDAFRQRVRSVVEEYVALAPDASKFAEHAALTLASDYAELLDAVRSSGSRGQSLQRAPALIGSAVSLSSSLVLGVLTGNPLVAAASFGSGMAAVSLTHVLEVARRRRELEGHYLYWRVSASRPRQRMNNRP